MKYLAYALLALAFVVNAEAGLPGTVAVPDTGSTLMLLGTALSALAFFRRR